MKLKWFGIVLLILIVIPIIISQESINKIPLLCELDKFGNCIIVDFPIIKQPKVVTNYTISTKTECVDNSCVKSYYSSPRYSDSKGTLINETPSLKYSEFKPYNIIIDEDGENIVKVLDYNSTSVKLEVSLESKEQKIVPVKLFEKQYVTEEKEVFEDKKVVLKNVTELKDVELIEKTKSVDLTKEFSKDDWYDLSLNQVLHIGENSTTIQLNYTSSDTWTVPGGVTSVEVLVVAGGAGGGCSNSPLGGGGGGAGGLIFQNYSVTFNQEISIIVGTGGAGTNNMRAQGGYGGNSTFGNLTAIGGGGGGGRYSPYNGNSGGSGGGAVSSGGTGGTGLQPTSEDGGFGNDGEDAGSAVEYYGGGGGAGEAGGTDNIGEGGDGIDLSDVFGTTYGDNGWFAGGGGGRGKVGGLGGGGTSSTTASGGKGMDGTGSGGGGGDYSYYGGNGGTGIVLFRYNQILNIYINETSFNTTEIDSGERIRLNFSVYGEGLVFDTILAQLTYPNTTNINYTASPLISQECGVNPNNGTCSDCGGETTCGECSGCSWTYRYSFPVRFDDDGVNSGAISFTAMSNTSYVSLLNPLTDNDVMYANQWSSKTTTGYTVTLQDDDGGTELGNFMYGAIPIGTWDLGTNDFMECGTWSGSASGSTITLSNTMKDTNYAFICTPILDDDAPACKRYTTKSTTQVSWIANDDGGNLEIISNLDWCVIQHGEYDLGIKIKSGTFSGDSTPEVSFSVDFDSTNYSVFITDDSSDSFDACVCEIDTRTVSGFTATCEDDGDVLCSDVMSWVAFENGDNLINSNSCDGTPTCDNSTQSACEDCGVCQWGYTVPDVYSIEFNDTYQSGEYLISSIFANATTGETNTTLFSDLGFNVTEDSEPINLDYITVSKDKNLTNNQSIWFNWSTAGNYTRSWIWEDSSIIYNNTAKNFNYTGLTNNTEYTFNLTVSYNSTIQNSTVFSITTEQNPVPECVINSDCPSCEKCVDTVCVAQTDAEDLKDDCGTTNCYTGNCDGASACDIYSSGEEGSCDACEECNDADSECDYIADHNQDNTGDNTCNEECKECNGAGECDNQAENDDYFDDCGVIQCDDGATPSYYDDWDTLICYYKDDEADGACDNSGGNCKDATDYCSANAQGDSTGVECDCADAEVGCTGTTVGSCDNEVCKPDIFDIRWNDTMINDSQSASLRVNVTSSLGDVDKVIVQIRAPNSSQINYTMKNVNGLNVAQKTCWQEQTNESNVKDSSDGDCLFDYTGSYDMVSDNVNPQYLIDGNYGTVISALHNYTLYAIYKKPTIAVGGYSTWISSSGTESNYSISDACWNYDSDAVHINFTRNYGVGIIVYCLNDTNTWEKIGEHFSLGVKEEGIYWTINYNMSVSTDSWEYNLTYPTQLGYWNETNIFANITGGIFNTTTNYLGVYVNVSLPCVNNPGNSTPTSWVNMGNCLIDDTIYQNRSYQIYDLNNCGNYTNSTIYEYQYDTCDYCTPSISNISWSSWNLGDCLITDYTNDNRTTHDYDTNDCYTITSLPSDDYTNITYWEYRNNVNICDYCTPSILNTSYTSWNIGDCTITDYTYDNRSKHSYDDNTCYNITSLPADDYTNVTYYDYTTVTNACDYCTPSESNTSLTAWVNMTLCLINDNRTQNQSKHSYDSNTCYDITSLGADIFNNVTFWYYQNITCDYCTPTIDYTSYTGWSLEECLITDYRQENRSREDYDTSYCYETTGLDADLHTNTTYWDYRDDVTSCDYCTPNIINTSWYAWINTTTCNITDNYEQNRTKERYDDNYCYETTGLGSDLFVNLTYIEYQVGETDCDYCTPNPVNTSWSSWYSMNQCNISDVDLYNRSSDGIDGNTCYVITGLVSDEYNTTTVWNYKNDTCNYCSYNIDYSAWTGWSNVTASCGTNNRTSFDSVWVTCCNITGISSDCYLTDDTNLNYTYGHTDTLTCSETGVESPANAIMLSGAYMLVYLAFWKKNKVLASLFYLLIAVVSLVISITYPEIAIALIGFGTVNMIYTIIMEINDMRNGNTNI